MEHLGPGGQDGLVALELSPAAEEDSVRELRILESGAEVLAQSTLGNLNTRGRSVGMFGGKTSCASDVIRRVNDIFTLIKLP